MHPAAEGHRRRSSLYVLGVEDPEPGDFHGRAAPRSDVVKHASQVWPEVTSLLVYRGMRPKRSEYWQYLNDLYCVARSANGRFAVRPQPAVGRAEAYDVTYAPMAVASGVNLKAGKHSRSWSIENGRPRELAALRR